MWGLFKRNRSERTVAIDHTESGNVLPSHLKAEAGASLEERRALIQVARGKQPADLVFRNGQVVNVFSAEVYPADVAVYHGYIAGIGPSGSYRGTGRNLRRGHPAGLR